MATVTITLSLISGTHRLLLEDSGDHSGPAPDFISNVLRGDTVFWVIKPESGIEDILDIRAKKGQPFSIFNKNDPHKNGQGKWKGKVKEDAEGEDAYDIEYKVNGETLTEDPIIRIPPP